MWFRSPGVKKSQATSSHAVCSIVMMSSFSWQKTQEVVYSCRHVRKWGEMCVKERRDQTRSRSGSSNVYLRRVFAPLWPETEQHSIKLHSTHLYSGTQEQKHSNRWVPSSLRTAQTDALHAVMATDSFRSYTIRFIVVFYSENKFSFLGKVSVLLTRWSSWLKMCIVSAHPLIIILNVYKYLYYHQKCLQIVLFRDCVRAGAPEFPPHSIKHLTAGFWSWCVRPLYWQQRFFFVLLPFD